MADWDGARDWQWHGTMTSTVAAGNGFLSHGLYSGLAHAAELVLIQVRTPTQRAAAEGPAMVCAIAKVPGAAKPIMAS